MAKRAITFDFHNTLAACDAWFQIEVRTLVSDFLRWCASQAGSSIDAETAAEADARYRRLRRAIHIHGHELPAERCVAAVLDDLGLPWTRAEIERGVEATMHAVADQVAPLPGVIDVVTALASEGVVLGVVSSAVYHPFLDWTLKRFGIGDAFAAVTTSASAGFYKSRPEIYWGALQRLDVRPRDAIHVGDSFRFDVEAAHQAGMGTVWVAGDRTADPSAPLAPDLTLVDLLGAAPRLLDLLDGHDDPRRQIGGAVLLVGQR